jgi:hypothetical protein
MLKHLQLSEQWDLVQHIGLQPIQQDGPQIDLGTSRSGEKPDDQV